MASGSRNADLNVVNWQIELMTLLPTGDKEKGKSVDDLLNDLLKNPLRICRDENEKEALRRKVQKTLGQLLANVAWKSLLVCRVEGKNGLEKRIGESTKKTFWKWKEGKQRLIIPPPNADTCLALLMVERRLKAELPPATLEYLAPHFDDARRRLQQYGVAGNQYLKWQQKIVNQSPTQVLKPTKTPKDIHNAVLQSLFENYQLKLSYLKPDSDQSKTYEVCPLGLLMRGPITYLIAYKVSENGLSTAEDSSERMFALHRIRKAEVLEGRKARVPSGVSLESFIERGGSDFVIGKLANGQIIKLEMEVNANVAARLKETPLTENQTLATIGIDRFRLSASLPITMQLGWWVLGFGPRVEVIKPVAFREWIAAEHQNAASRYKDN